MTSCMLCHLFIHGRHVTLLSSGCEVYAQMLVNYHVKSCDCFTFLLFFFIHSQFQVQWTQLKSCNCCASQNAWYVYLFNLAMKICGRDNAVYKHRCSSTPRYVPVVREVHLGADCLLSYVNCVANVALWMWNVYCFVSVLYHVPSFTIQIMLENGLAFLIYCSATVSNCFLVMQ